MNSLHDFTEARPDVEPLDDTDVDRLWSAVVGKAADGKAADGIGDRRVAAVVVPVGAIDTPRGRRRVLLASAAAVVALVTGAVVLAERSNRDSVSMTTPDTSTASIDVAPGWTSFPSPPIEPRFQNALVATDDGIFMWGGCCVDDSLSEPHSDGAYFDGETGEWRVLPPAPDDMEGSAPVAVWAGNEVLVISGFADDVGVAAAAFDPAAFTWRSVESPSGHPSAMWRVDGVDGTNAAVVVGNSVELWHPNRNTWDAPIPIGQGFGDVLRAAGRDDLVLAATVDTTGDIALDCSQVRFRSYDLRTGRSQVLDPGTDDWAPTEIVPVGGSRFLVAGGAGCENAGLPVRQRAMIVDVASSTTTEVAAPIGGSSISRYPGMLAGDAVIQLLEDGRLLAFDVASETWTVGPSLLEADPAATDAVGETPWVWFDGRVVIPSPSYWTGQSCCVSSAQAWAVQVPTIPLDQSTEPIATTIAQQPDAFVTVTAETVSMAAWPAAPFVTWAMQIEVEDCMSEHRFGYQRMPRDEMVTANRQVFDDYQAWLDQQAASVDGWEAQRLDCNESVAASILGPTRGDSLRAEIRAHQMTGRDQIWTDADLIRLTSELVACVRSLGDTTPDPATDPQGASEAALNAVTGRMTDVPDNTLFGVDWQYQWARDRSAAMDAVCPMTTEHQRAHQVATATFEQQWLARHQDVARQLADEDNDDLARLRQVIQADALQGSPG